MFFSTSEYSEPEIVVVYDNNYEMSRDQEDDINNELSYRNMTYSPDTILVLMDESQELVNKGVMVVNTARPVEQLVSSMLNIVIEKLSKLTGSNNAMIDKYYFTCLTSKKDSQNMYD